MEQTIQAKTPAGTEYTATYMEDSVPRFRCEVPAKNVAFVAGYSERDDALMSLQMVPGFGHRVGLKMTDTAREWVNQCRAAHLAREEEKRQALRREIKEKGRKRLAPFFEQARERGERVEVRRYTTGCSDRHEECDLDIVTEWALPDGTIETTRIHTW